LVTQGPAGGEAEAEAAGDGERDNDVRRQGGL
jgi:hypothetical protein